ncbi:MAG TPA: hypothetical protein VK752_17605 [Bryobacteraceae bacterium]|nr:hypothetical protein [Bryobacteraceae bacterium]
MLDTVMKISPPYEGGAYDYFLSAYLRGEAYLAEHQGKEAVVEFQKILDHRGVVLNSPIGALARFGRRLFLCSPSRRN